MTEHSSEARSPETEGPQCFFACSDCSTDSSHHRKVISHIFGRNKSCTTSIPSSVWVHYCRKHYQRARYRADSQWALTQCDLAMKTIDNMELWGGVESFDMVLRRREMNRRPESGERQNRERQPQQQQQRQQKTPSPSAPEEYNMLDSPASLPLTISQPPPMTMNMSPVEMGTMGMSPFPNGPSMADMVSQTGPYGTPSPPDPGILGPRGMLQNGSHNSFPRSNSHLQSSAHFQFPQTDVPLALPDAAGFPFYGYHNHSLSHSPAGLDYGQIYHASPYATDHVRSSSSQFLPVNAQQNFSAHVSNLLGTASLQRQQPVLPFQEQQHFPGTAPFSCHTEAANVPPPLGQPAAPLSQPSTRPSTSSSITTTSASTRNRRKRAPTIYPHPVPTWLKGRIGPRKSFHTVRSILLNLRTYLDRIKARGQQPQFPDIEILPNLKTHDDNPDDTQNISNPLASNMGTQNHNLAQGQEGGEAEADTSYYNLNETFNGFANGNIKFERYAEGG